MGLLYRKVFKIELGHIQKISFDLLCLPQNYCTSCVCSGKQCHVTNKDIMRWIFFTETNDLLLSIWIREVSQEKHIN